MTTALIISELIPLHDDALVADINAAFDEIDREVAAARNRVEHQALLLDVEWLVDELSEDTIRVSREALEISLELHEQNNDCDEVAEVA
jgi:hypothetical protein